MSGYYDWAPARPLTRPLVLSGFLGARLGKVANVLSGMTGYRLVDLPRGVEHLAGQTLGALMVAQGVQAIDAYETSILDQALRVPPPPIIALSHRSLLDRAIRARVARETTHIYIKVSLDTSVQRVRRAMGENSAVHYAWFEGVIPDHDDLRKRFLPLQAAYEAADIVVDGEPRAGTVAESILQALDL